MLPKLCLVASVALGIQASFALAAESGQQAISQTAQSFDRAGQLGSQKTYQTTGRAVQGKPAGEAGLKDQDSNPTAAQDGFNIEYPALALLAVAIISMAALSRRDGLTIGDKR